VLCGQLALRGQQLPPGHSLLDHRTLRQPAQVDTELLVVLQVGQRPHQGQRHFPDQREQHSGPKFDLAAGQLIQLDNSIDCLHELLEHLCLDYFQPVGQLQPNVGRLLLDHND